MSRRRGRILFTTLPYPGCLHPHLAVACALKTRGHEVAFYTSAQAKERVEGEGFACFTFSPRLDAELEELVFSPNAIGLHWSRPWQLRPRLRRFLVDVIPYQLSDLERVLTEWPADVVACDPAVWAPFLILNETRKVPVAMVSWHAGCTLPGPDAPPVGLGLPPPRDWRTRLLASAGRIALSVFASDIRRTANAIRARHGLPPVHGPAAAAAARLPLFIVPTSPEFDYNRRDLPPSVHYVGPLCWYPAQEPPAWLSALPQDWPLVHATEGTVHVQKPLVLRAAAHGLANQPMHVILTTGGNRAPAELGLGSLAPNVRVESWINHGDLLPRTDVLICTGGSGAVLAALEAGVPMVVVPTEWDHADVARRVVEAGVGVRLSSRQCTPRRVREAVEHVLQNPTYRANARRVSAGMKRCGGAARAAELIEGLVPVRSPI